MKQIITLLFILNITTQIFAQEKQHVSLEDIWRFGTFRSKSVYGLRSMNDGKHYTTLSYNEDGSTSINQYEYASGQKIKEIVNSYQLVYNNDTLHISDYSFSNNEQYLLLYEDMQPIYRRSWTAFCYLYNLNTKELLKISDNAISYPELSPDNKWIAYIYENNIYLYNIQDKTTRQVTTDGTKNKIINGTTDWVYEEEFSIVKGAYWSPDGKYLAYYKFDESHVKEYSIPFYGKLYPELYTYKYPKAGEENSKVEIHLFDIQKNTDEKIPLSNYEYIPRIQWTNSSDWLSIQTMNRHQNELIIWVYHPSNNHLKKLYTENNKYYIEITDNLTFIDNNQYFIITSELSGYNHLYLYDFQTGKKIKQITSGNWDVAEFYGYDSHRKTIFYTSHESSPLNTEVYSIQINGKGKKRLSPKNGTSYASFSKTFDYFIHYHSDAATPTTVTLHQANGKLIRTLEDNAELKERLKNYVIAPMEFFKIKTEDNYELNAWMIKPPHFDEEKKYPVLMYVYGGPGSQTVTNSWGGSNFFWYQILADKGYIIVSVDNRGTGARGEEFKKSTYKQLGKYESEDQIKAARYLASLPYVDSSRIGIWGWSFGGYLSSLCLFKGNDVFKMAIAVAPVTNWRYYDTIYTERYMQTPQENPDGYDNNSPINHVEKLKGKYLLVHGLADDNVHFQNAADLISALVEADKQFDMHLYPNKNHGIYGGNTRYHLYTKLTDFIEQNL